MIYRLASILLPLLLSVAAMTAERTGERLLYDFENPSELDSLREKAENVALDIVQDNGVTHGRTCCRVVFKQGGGFGVVILSGERVQSWSGYAAIAFDVFQERAQKTAVNVELMDGASRNYATRCTTETVVRPGRNTVLVPIDHAKRNGKEGRDWSELEPQDKIDLDHLTQVKIFLQTPTEGGDLVWWIDNVRLLTESAVAGPAMHIDLPIGSRAFAFGRSTPEVVGFIPVPVGQAFDAATGFGFEGAAAPAMGKGWPDRLTGRGVLDPAGGETRFTVALPNGDYRCWLAGGMAIDSEAVGANYALRVGDQTLFQDTPTPEQVRSDKYLYRFLPTPYSERPDALYVDYIDRMYPTWDVRVAVHDGKLAIAATRFWLSALVIMPAADDAGFTRLAAQIRAQRILAFTSSLTPDPQHKPVKQPGDGAAVAFIPDTTTVFTPATAPSPSERSRRAYDLAAAPGERIVFRLGLTVFETIGRCRFAVSALKGPSAIPATAARLYVMDYRVRGDAVQEAALRPQDHLDAEKGITWCFYAWLCVPDDAKAGDYTGTVTVTPASGVPWSFPLALRVHSFRLQPAAASLGMYYDVPVDAQTHRDQLKFMREIGFTATVLAPGRITGVKDDRVQITFDEAAYQRVKDAGFGSDPRQLQMGSALGPARTLARTYLGFGARVDQQPGCELADARLKPLFIDYLRQFSEFVRAKGLAIAVEIVDEPREVPNPWNRTLADTITYADWMREAGIATGFVTPMGDSGSGKDYTALIDHAGIISTHAGKGSERLMRGTIAAGKPLWLYNTGMDRLSWGFYAWRVGACGRWEWHFCFSEPGGAPGYPNTEEWMNPFTTRDAATVHAPSTFAGSMLFKSSYFDVADGIADAAYVATLESALTRARGVAAKNDAVARGEALLAEMRQAIPF
nr:hypothetical protein [Planctomycetota bacterium]